MLSFKTFIQDLNELNLTSAADVNEILLAWYMADSNWRKVSQGRQIKSLYDKAQSMLGDEEFEDQSERAWAMAHAIDGWAIQNGYKGGVIKTWWTARKGVLSKAVGYEVDSRKNPTDVLLQFGDKQFLGISAKSTKGKGDIGFKNPGAGTFDRILGSSLSDMLKKYQSDFATKHDLSQSASTRKKEIRADQRLVKASEESRTTMLNDLRNHLMNTFTFMKEEDLREFILDECMDAKPVLPKYIKVTGHGKYPNYSASIVDPLKDDKATAMAADPLGISNVGNDSIGIAAGGMKILKVRLKQESQAMASALKISCDPWR